MTLLKNTFIKRSTVFAVLLVWLFAFSAGWANACLLQDRGTHAHASSDGAFSVAKVPMISAGHAGAVAAHDDDPDSEEAPCQKVCDEVSQSVVKAQLAFDLTDPGLAAPVSTLWTTHESTLFALGSTRKLLPPTAGPPLRIRYARLAL